MNPYHHPKYRTIDEEWTPFEQATHLIIGWITGYPGGGILGSARDEFTAHRLGKLAREAGFQNVIVMPNEAEAYLVVSECIGEQLVATPAVAEGGA